MKTFVLADAGRSENLQWLNEYTRIKIRRSAGKG